MKRKHANFPFCGSSSGAQAHRQWYYRTIRREEQRFADSLSIYDWRIKAWCCALWRMIKNRRRNKKMRNGAKEKRIRVPWKRELYVHKCTYYLLPIYAIAALRFAWCLSRGDDRRETNERMTIASIGEWRWDETNARRHVDSFRVRQPQQSRNGNRKEQTKTD